MYHSFLIHSFADGHLGCFHVLAIIYKQCCDEHWGIRVSFSSGFLGVYAQQWDCWVIRQLTLNARHHLPAMVGQSQTCPQVGTVTSFLVNLTWLTLTTALRLKIRDLGYNFFFLSWHPNANPAFQTEVRSAWPCRWLLGHAPPSELLQTPPISASPKSHPQVGSAGALTD